MNILFIGGQGNNPDANSVCVRNMAIEMLKRGHKVRIIAMGEALYSGFFNVGEAQIDYIPADYYRRLTGRVMENHCVFLRIWFRLISVIRHLLLLFSYPNTSPSRARRVAHLAEKIVRKEQIDLVICVFTPYDNIYAGIFLKRKFGKAIKVISYHLDLRTASINPSKLVRDYIHKHALISLASESHIVDKILIPYSGKNETEGVEGAELSRIRFTGFPVYLKSSNGLECQVPFNKDSINVCYIGTLSYDNRDPRPILHLLEAVSNIANKPIIVHIWGDINGFADVLAESEIAKYHGMIEPHYSWYINSQADFLLNIGNAIAYDMLPSKVFSLFATGKPIINVINHPKDVTLPFFERYQHSIDIRTFEPLDENVHKLSVGIESLINEPLKEENGLFDDFKPETICDLILAE